MTKKSHRSFFARHYLLTIFGVLMLILVGVAVARVYHDHKTADAYQDSLESFYTPPNPLPNTKPGTLIRSEKMTNITVPGGGTAYRILYVSQLPDGKPAVSSGMVFVPTATAPAGGRKVVAWAHGTRGLGNACTPSRSQTDALQDTDNWLDGMMQRGWVVTATDYVGVGTPGDPYYLVGKSESNDVLNSVRAARNFSTANASNTFAVWGHSQGGHAALETGQYATSYAPELNMIAVAAAAPAAELPALFSEQSTKAVAWAIGPDTAVSWPNVYTDLPVDSVLTPPAQKQYKKLAYTCVQQQAIGLLLRSAAKQQFFQSNPMNNPAWFNAATLETPNTSLIPTPIYLTQGLSDTVVLPDTTALLVQKTCAAGKNVTTNWLGEITHQKVAVVAGPNLTAWLQDRFNNLPAQTSCNQPLPLSPASPPSQP